MRDWAKAGDERREFIRDHLGQAQGFSNRDAILLAAIQQSVKGGLYLEFGTSAGRTARVIAPHVDRLYTFDSFEGLPEDWNEDDRKGAFASPVPVLPSNVTIVPGWFADSLPKWLHQIGGYASMIFVDCDLYSSTKTVLDNMRPRLIEGTIIVFDEFYGMPEWREHEYRAWSEFVAGHDTLAWRYWGYVVDGKVSFQVAVQIGA